MADFIDHGTDVTDALKVIIRKDDWVASKPWHADLEFTDGTVWKNWQSFFRTKKSLIENALAAAPNATIVNA